MDLPQLSPRLPRYDDFDPIVPVWCATPGLSGAIHRFFDSSPFSPSGRYLALTRLRFENRLPAPGDPADVAIVDLESGAETILAETRGWDTQLGAQVQWGADDSELFFNDLDTVTWQPFGVKLDPFSGSRTKLDGTVYMVSPDGKWAASPCLLRTSMTQPGYGVVVPTKCRPGNRGASDSDGVYLTDTSSGACRLFLSFAEIVAAAPDAFPPELFDEGDFYGFHTKWNPQGTRLLFVVRWLSPRSGRRRRNAAIAIDVASRKVHVAVPPCVWSRGGNHPQWCPDGTHVTMNLNLGGEDLRFVRVRYDGSGRVALNDSIRGSGHPTLHPSGRYVLTDAKPNAPVAFEDGTVPLRWIDLQRGSETTVLRIRARPPFEGPRRALRVDLHPAWDRSFRRVAFNACPDGSRRVYVADLTTQIAAPGEA